MAEPVHKLSRRAALSAGVAAIVAPSGSSARREVKFSYVVAVGPWMPDGQGGGRREVSSVFMTPTQASELGFEGKAHG